MAFTSTHPSTHLSKTILILPFLLPFTMQFLLKCSTFTAFDIGLNIKAQRYFGKYKCKKFHKNELSSLKLCITYFDIFFAFLPQLTSFYTNPVHFWAIFCSNFIHFLGQFLQPLNF